MSNVLITERLDQIEARNNSSEESGEMGPFDDVRALIAALRGVVKQHGNRAHGKGCTNCWGITPCPTQKAIASALGVTL